MGQVSSDDTSRRPAELLQSCHSVASPAPGRTSPKVVSCQTAKSGRARASSGRKVFASAAPCACIAVVGSFGQKQMMIRPQYHFRPSENGLLTWKVGRLIELSAGLQVQRLDLNQVDEVDENYWYAFEGQLPTCRSILRHYTLIEEADLSFPIILDADGRLMDGMHRVCKAIRRGDTHIMAVQFIETPKPDYVGLRPEELPYE